MATRKRPRADEVAHDRMGYVALPRARQEGRWAWRAGQPLTAQPYCEEVNGAEAVLWQIGWLELAQLDCHLDAVMYVQSDNCNNMVADLDGEFPACKPALGTQTCERCGRSTRKPTGKACTAIPVDQRWSFKPHTHLAEHSPR